MMKHMRAGFTLLELLISMIIIAILAGLISGSFFSSLKKGRDARRKSDLQQIQRALELFYEDKRAYPDFSLGFGSMALCETQSAASCGSEKTYMQLIPADPQNTTCSYYYVHETSPNGEGYSLYSSIENSNDAGPGVKQAGYSGTNCGSCTCRYKLGSSNYP